MRFDLHPLIAVAAWLFLFVLAGSRVGAANEEKTIPLPVGVVLTAGAAVDGTDAPSGSTLFSGSRLSTRTSATPVHLTGGQIVELGSHSSALFQKAPGGEMEIRVVAGSLRFRGVHGNLLVAGPEDAVAFFEQEAGHPVYQNQEGVVAVLVQPADAGQRRLVVQDARLVEPTSELVVKSRDQRIQELKCSIEAIRDQVVTVDEDLIFSFAPQDLLIQRLPVVQHGVYAVLTSPAQAGDEQLEVDSATRINPLEQVEVRHPSRPIREVACVRYTQGFPESAAAPAAADDAVAGRGEIVRLFSGLRNDYPMDAEVRQGVRDEPEGIRTTLIQAAAEGTQTLQVRAPHRIDPMLQVMIRSADGSRFEAYCVAAVDHNQVILAEDLDFDYPAGSEVLQGRSARTILEEGVRLQRAANCCCCCGLVGGLAPVLAPGTRRFPWWWLLPVAAVPPALLISGGGDDPPPIEGELPPTPIVPRRRPSP